MKTTPATAVNIAKAIQAEVIRAALEHGTTPHQATVDFPGGVWSCVKVS